MSDENQSQNKTGSYKDKLTQAKDKLSQASETINKVNNIRDAIPTNKEELQNKAKDHVKNKAKRYALDKSSEWIKRAKNLRQGAQAGESALEAGEGIAGATEATTGAAGLTSSTAAGAGTAAGGTAAGASVAAGTGAAAGGTAAAAGGMAAGAGGATVTVAAAETNPVGWIITATIFLLLFFAILIFIIVKHRHHSTEDTSATPPQQSTSSTPVPGLTLTKTGPDHVNNGDNISYSISAVYTDTGDVTVYDQIPDQTTFISADGTHKQSGNIISWRLQDNSKTGITTGAFTFNLTVKPTADNIVVTNTAWAEAPIPTPTPSSNDLGNGNESPNSSTCNSFYQLDNPLGKNFGDPSCTLLGDKNKIMTLLKQLDPTHATIWFWTVLPCESGYIANAYASPAIGTPDPVGAWGLFQMGRGRNGQYDHGDVAWQQQISNAVNYNEALIQNGIAWRYWQCASGLWGSKQ